MSPILVRPVREQLEHDRVIRLLQAKYKRKFDVAINPGSLQAAPIGVGPSAWYPDLVLHTTERGRKLAGVVEVETAESVNNLEAMSQWAAFAKQRAEFHLYVPAASIDTTRRLCVDNGIAVSEIWAYHSVGDQVRFVLVQRAGGSVTNAASAKSSAGPSRAAKSQVSGRAPVPKVAAPKAGTGKAPSSKVLPVRVAAAKTVPPKAAQPKTTLPKTALPKATAKTASPKAMPARKPAKAAVSGRPSASAVSKPSKVAAPPSAKAAPLTGSVGSRKAPAASRPAVAPRPLAAKTAAASKGAKRR